MKKFVKLAVLALATIGLCSCNMNVGWGNYNFTKVHSTTPDYSKCIDIKSWKNDDMGIEVKTEDYGSLFLSEGTYILVEDTCPICGR